jgi:hypothetical protein
VYEVDIGKYPSSLDALLKNPGDKKWKGPYIKTKEWPPTDAWGTPLRLSLSGGTNGSLPSLNSAGPDRTFDTADDLKSDGTSFESTTPGGKKGAFDPWIGRYKFAQDSKSAGKPLDIIRGEQGFSILLEGRKFALEQEGDHFRFTTGDMVWNKDRTSRELEWFIIAYDPDRQQFYMGAPDNPQWRQYLEAR